MARQDITGTLGQVIRRRRRAKKLSQEKLGFAAGLSLNYISLVELGSSSPTVDSLVRIAAALDETGSSLLAQAESLLQSQAPVRRPRR